MKELKFVSPVRTAAILIILVICFVIYPGRPTWSYPYCLPLSSLPCCSPFASAAFLSVLVAGLLSAAFLTVVISRLVHLARQAPQFAFRTNLLSQFLLVLLFGFFLLYLRAFFLEFFYKVFPSSEKSLIDTTITEIP